MNPVSPRKEKCIQCNLCVKACSRNLISMEKEGIRIENEFCNECGHCFAVCPVEAIQMEGNPKDIVEKKEWKFDPKDFLDFQKNRRSIRHFQEKKVEREKIDQILEAARFAPTATNSQRLRYIVLEEKMDKIRNMSMESLYKEGMAAPSSSKTMAYYYKAWVEMYEAFQKEGKDQLFFHAPQLVIVVSDNKSGYGVIDGSIAASRMELQAYAQGLGICYIGFFEEATKYDKKILEEIGLKEKENIILSFVIGYPEIQYSRSVQRKELDVNYL
ncbi:nitroreductase family protein [Peptoniphilus sp. KCTC 25270]|uniref:nitroreductase family protein n=1 Tax=Peptoniphilus sp. KCTC 25270 TaxID=2897414 RepID=UPI001E447C9D|nr:nitroreductase family protein [Peptoniphilus sp. KCTC 25270]MCD1146670.1 nitroreductase family protein [Peptoniphilus sp. KCTC 25270]